MNEKEWTTIEIENLTRNVTEKHLHHIFGLYAKGSIKTERHFSDYSRALIFFKSKDDARYAYDHLAQRKHSKRSDDRKEESKVEDDEYTRIDGQRVYLRIMYYEHSYRRHGHDRPKERYRAHANKRRSRYDDKKPSNRK